jgi:hemoglobin/transferrin/lactoferrin receptor protein
VGTQTCVFDRAFDFRQRLNGANAQLEKLFDTGGWSHHLIYGVDWSLTHTAELRDALRTNLTTGVSTRVIPPDNFPARDFPVSDTTLAGAFIQDELKFGPWSVIPGLRYDYYRLEPLPDFLFTKDNPGITPVEKKDEAFSPKLGVLYRLTPNYTLFGQYAHGFRAPPYNDVNIGFTNLTFGYTAIPNPDLRPERSRGLEVGVRGSFGASNFSVAAFYNRYKDFINSLSTLPCPGDPRCSTVVGITFQSVNLTNVRIYGFEARGEAVFGNGFGALAALSCARGEDTDRDQPVNSVEPLKLVTGLRYNAPGERYGAQFVGTFVERKKHIDQTTTPVLLPSPGFAIFDLLGYWNITRQLTLNAGIFNLTDRKYFLWSDLQGAGGGTSPLAVNVATLDRFSQPGRKARVTLKYQF